MIDIWWGYVTDALLFWLAMVTCVGALVWAGYSCGHLNGRTETDELKDGQIAVLEACLGECRCRPARGQAALPGQREASR